MLFDLQYFFYEALTYGKIIIGVRKVQKEYPIIDKFE